MGEYCVVTSDDRCDPLGRLEQEARRWAADIVWASGPWVGKGRFDQFTHPLIVDAPSLSTRLIGNEILSHGALIRVPGELKRMVSKVLSAPRRIREERRSWEIASLITPCSQYERTQMPRRFQTQSLVVPNGATATVPFQKGLARAPRLLLVGTLHYPPNAEAASLLVDRILPQVRRRHPDVAVDIVGAGPSPVLHYLRRHKRVVVHGFVDDLEPLYVQASHVVVPLRRHTGTNLKILEAIAHGVPVVTTAIGLEGLAELRAGRDVAVSRTWKGCVDLLVELLDEPGRSSAMALSAWERVHAELTWDIARRSLREAMEIVSPG